MQHEYHLTVKWTGNTGQGTATYQSYDRSFTVSEAGKPDLLGSADSTFKGDPKKWNPEEFLVSAVATCHMLSYLYLCAKNKIVVLEYEDKPHGIMKIAEVGKFEKITLNPKIKISDTSRINDAKELHHQAHQECFIANSVNFPIEVKAQILA